MIQIRGYTFFTWRRYKCQRYNCAFPLVIEPLWINICISLPLSQMPSLLLTFTFRQFECPIAEIKIWHQQSLVGESLILFLTSPSPGCHFIFNPSHFIFNPSFPRRHFIFNPSLPRHFIFNHFSGAEGKNVSSDAQVWNDHRAGTDHTGAHWGHNALQASQGGRTAQ